MTDDITKTIKVKMSERMDFLEEQLAVVAEMLIITFMTMKKHGGFSDRLYKKLRQMSDKYLKIRMKKVET